MTLKGKVGTIELVCQGVVTEVDRLLGEL